MDLVELINLAVGLIVGLATGFYFERRNARDARVAKQELQDQLARLRSTVLSMGATQTVTKERQLTDIESALLNRALSTQDPSGRVRRSELVAYLMEEGFSRSQIDEAMVRLVESGLAREDEPWMYMA